MDINSKTNTRSLQVDPSFTLLNLNAEKAFLLGLIYGDGHIGKNNSIEICSSDCDIIENINRIFDYKLHIIKKTKNANSIYINSKKISNELRSQYMLKSKKSNNITFPNIDEKFVPYFLSGEIAADGSLSYRKKYKKDFNIYIYSCSKIFLTQIKDLINKKLNINGSIIISNKNQNTHYNVCYRYSLYNKKALIFCNYVFENTNKHTRNNRKYKIYMEYKNDIEQINIKNKKRKRLILSLKKKYYNLDSDNRQKIIFTLKEKNFTNKEIKYITNIPNTSLYRLLKCLA